MFLRPGTLVLAVLISIVSTTPAPGATYLWDGGGGDDNLATANNWATNSAPSSGGNHLLQFLGPDRPTPYNLTMYFVSGIDFPLDGNQTAFTLSGARLNVGSGGIDNWSAATQTINNPITLQGGAVSHPFVSSSGFLVLENDIDLATGIMKVTGEFGQVRLNGTVTATSGSIDVGNAGVPGTLVLGGTVLTDVDTQIGTLVIDTDQPQPDYSTLQFLDGTHFESLGTHNITQTLQLTGNVTFSGTGTLRSESTISGSGNLIVDTSLNRVLGLGPANNISPFSGSVTINQGELELNGGGLIAQLDGAIEVGDFSGSAQTAALIAANTGVVADGASLTVRSDGRADLKGPIAFSALALYGGTLAVDDEVTVDTIAAGMSARTAELDAPWAIPSQPAAYHVDVTDGVANPDLRLLQGAVGGGHVVVSGAGEVEFDGVASAGPGAMTVLASTVTLNRTGTGSALDFLSIDGGEVRTAASHQFATWTGVELNSGSVLDIGSNQDSAQVLTMDEAEVRGAGTLTLGDDLTVFGDGIFEPTLSFTIPSAGVDIEPGGGLVCGFLDGAEIYLAGGGNLTPEEINCNFTVAQGALRFQGFIDGDLTVDDRLVVLRDDGAIVVNGTLTCGPNSTLNVQLDLSGAAAGDSWTLINANAFAGSFGTLELPAPPTGHYLYVEYVGNDLVLHLEAIDFAELDFAHGTNGQALLLGEVLDGVAAVDFTVQGFDDVQLCAVTVDGLTSPSGDGVAGIRLYDASTGNLVAATQQFFAQTSIPESRTFPLAVLLQPLDTYRLVLYGSEKLSYAAFLPGRALPYAQSTLVEIEAAWLEQSSQDVFPTTPADQFPQVRMDLGPCDLTAAPETPERYELALQARPNPFNPSTTVSFELPEPGRVSVEAFDARGRRVATLLQESRPAGRFDIRWNGLDDRGAKLGSGVYFLRLSHPSGEKVRRVTLLK